MTDFSAESVDPAPATRLIAFEHPLTERMRTFMRLELLHRQSEFHGRDATEFGTRAAITSLLEMLTVASRGDVRTDALKELDRHLERLLHYRSTPGIDEERLSGMLEKLESLRNTLAAAGKQYLADLRENEFLSAILHRSAIPGGTCAFDLPEYGYWLQMPAANRLRELRGWLSLFRPLNDAIAQVLWLTRESSQPRSLIATGGFYQYTLSRKEPLQLVRILVQHSGGLYPRISAGPQRFTIYFMEWVDGETRTQQTLNDVEFGLALC
jgi:cell division protein ZapD